MDWLHDILQGDALRRRRAIAKTITLLESTRAEHRAQGDELLTALLPHTGRAMRLGISGVPLFNGYLSKTLLHEGLVHAALHAGWLAPLLRGTEVLFLLSGGLTFAYMLRLYLCLFRQKNADPALQAAYDGNTSCMTPLSSCVLLAGAAVLLALGVPPVSTALAALASARRYILSSCAGCFVPMAGTGSSGPGGWIWRMRSTGRCC